MKIAKKHKVVNKYVRNNKYLAIFGNGVENKLKKLKNS